MTPTAILEIQIVNRSTTVCACSLGQQTLYIELVGLFRFISRVKMFNGEVFIWIYNVEGESDRRERQTIEQADNDEIEH